MKFSFIPALLIAAVMFGCNSSTDSDNENALNPDTMPPAASANPSSDSAQRTLIENYAKKHNLKGSFTPSGLFVVIENPGTGANPAASSTVKVEYTGYFLNGEKFDGSKAGDPLEFGFGRVIKGWGEGIPKFKKGGNGKLIIPSKLAYGPEGREPIPPNTVLVFDVKLVDFR